MLTRVRIIDLNNETAPLIDGQQSYLEIFQRVSRDIREGCIGGRFPWGNRDIEWSLVTQGVEE